jgi:threonine/homoserine/homoserine lactone efflux protein
MTITQAVLGFGTVAVLLTLIPGLDTTLALRTALVKGRRHGFLAVLGINLGLLTWGAAAAVGAAALLAASETAYRLLTVAGALYMAYLGVMMIVKSFRGTEQDTDAPAATSASGTRSFLVGFWTNLLNPKIGVFYIATIPQFIPADASPLGMGLLLASIHAVLGLAWLGFIVTGASAARRWLSSARALRIIDRVAGTVLVGFGAKLAFDARA